jgi:acetyl esterase/lipase
MRTSLPIAGAALVATLLALPLANAGLRERLAQRHAEAPGIAGARVLRDVAYGGDPRQRFDVYVPRVARDAPVIFLVHGGGWRNGDKAMDGVVENKVARWVPHGVTIVSTNYRMLPDADPLVQARDVAAALAAAQRKVATLGGNPDRFVLMGHSAGGHLVALLAAAPEMAREAGARPWLGTVLLDAGTVDVVAKMQQRHFPLFDQAFGNDARFWTSVSPMQQLHARPAPILAVCSSQRTDSCPPNRRFVDKVRGLGGRAELLPQALSHRDINVRLGEENNYTLAIEHFLRSLGVRV